MEKDDSKQAPEPLLNKEEIDSLLKASEPGENTTLKGINALINTELVTYERLPMLEVIFDRLIRLLSTSLRNLTSDNVDVTLEEITSTRFGEYLDQLKEPSMIGVFKAEEWDNFGLISINEDLTYTILNVLLGGRQGKINGESRHYTTIERGLVERMTQVILSDLSSAFEPLSPVKFRFERLETNPRFATIVRPANATILVRLKIEVDQSSGILDFILPNATLEPIRDLLLQMFMGEKFGRDAIWETHLGGALWDTGVEISALLETLTLPLNEVVNWQVGSRLDLNVTPQSIVKLFCGSVLMFEGVMGQREEHVAIKITEQLYNKEEALP